MTLYVMEIEGRAVIAFPAENERKADELAKSDLLLKSLTALKPNRRPIWDGKGDISVRSAQADEKAVWEGSFVRALRDGDADEDDRDEWAVFLIDVVDSTDDVGGEDDY